MAYDYRGHRGHRGPSYTSDQQVYDEREQTFSQERQLYNDDYYEGNYQEECTDSDYRLQESTPTEVHYTNTSQHSYQDDIRNQLVDYTRNTQVYGRSNEFIRKHISHTDDYRDRISRVDEQYHDQHLYRNAPGAKYNEGGRRHHTSTREAQGFEQEMRENDRNKYQNRNSFQPGHSHSQSHNFRRYGIEYEHAHTHDKTVNKRDHTFDREQGLMTYDNIYELTEEDRESQITQDEHVEISETYKHRITDREDDYEERIVETNSSTAPQHFSDNEFFCDFSNYSKERQHKSLPYKKIATSMDSVVRNDRHSHPSSKHKQRKCLLSTPDIEPINTGLLPTPVESELDDTVLHSAETVPVYSKRDPTKLSTGLLQTPPDVYSTKMSTGLLPTPTVSPVEDETFSSPGLLPLPTYNPCDNSKFDKEVKPKINPSKGLLPIPAASVCSHPYMEREKFDYVSNYDKEFPLDNDVDCSYNNIQIESESSEMNMNIIQIESDSNEMNMNNIQIESESSEIEMITDKQSTNSDENQKLQNTNIQIQLTKTLEGMQKTMEILKQKIKTEKNLSGDMNKENPGNVKQGMEKELKNSTVVGENEIIVKRPSDVPINISSEIDHECTEKISESLDESEGEVNKTEPESEINENCQDSKSNIRSKTSNEQSENVMKESKDIIQEHSKRKQIGPEQPREYRTYREWRLARERMNKYFYSQSSESDANDNMKLGSGEGRYQRNQPSNKEKEKRQEEENALENESNRVEDTKTGSKTVNDTDNEKVMRNDEVRGKQMIESEKFIYKTNECSSRRNSSDSLSSHYSKESSASGRDRSKSRDHESDRSHKHSRNYYREHSDRNKKIDKEHYHEKYHKHSHYNRHSSNSKVNKYSSGSKDGKHCSCSKENKHSYSSKDDKYNSTSKENKYNASPKDSKHSSDDHKHSSSFKNSKYSSNSKERKHLSGSKEGIHSSSSKSSSDCAQRSKHKDIYLDYSNKIDDSAKKINNECTNFQNMEKGEINMYEKPKECTIETDSKMNLFEKLAIDNEKHTQNKNNNKGNLFENLDTENEIIDVVGEMSTDEGNEIMNRLRIEPPEKDVLAYKEPSQIQKLNDGKCMKTAFVKLFDINKSKVKETKKDTKESVKSRENIFDQLNDEISSVHNIHEPSDMNIDKENAPTRSNKSSGIVKPKLPISEDSSSDVDPFMKMRLFLNKDKKKTVQMNVLKNLKVLEKSAVFYDNTSDCVDKPVSCSGDKMEFSAYRHDKQKKEFVKFLKRVDKTLYWKDIKLILPRITLKRLDENDIKRLKYRLKTSKSEIIGFKQKENGNILQDESAERTTNSKNAYSSKIVENKNNKTYRRIIPVRYSSTEQSESSDLERVISQGEKRAVIDDSDDNLEGSLGSEDSICFDISDISDEESNRITSKQNMLEEDSNVDSELPIDSDLPIDPKSTSVEENTSKNIGLKINDPVENHVGMANEDNTSTVENNPFAQSRQENKKSENQTMKQSGSKMSCSESAGKSLRRKNYSDSSDSSEDESHCQHGSSAKYQRMQSSKSCEKKTGDQNHSNDDNGVMNKDTSPKDSVLRKLVPAHAKRLFKSSKRNKSNLSIMQMDGNADLIAGPPDESSGEEGDIEDNVINIDSDEECSSSQDLFADQPERLLQMSPKPKQIVDLTSTTNSITIKEEDKRNNLQVIDLNVNQEINSSSSETSRKTQDSGDDMKNDDDKDIVIKDEPDWLKCYTQEPDTIFLSDDDEMIMSVSQPVILVSDDETQDPEADEQTEVKVKQEKTELDLCGMQETILEYAFENYSSAEDWSDKGSDFEPENMFKSLEKQTNTKTDLVSPVRSMSDISLISEDDTLNSKTLVDDEKNSENEKEGFESSDGAVLSVNEDELLRSPTNDENLMTKDDDIVKESDENKARRSADFCSSDDEILSRSAFLLENQYMKTKTEIILSNNENNSTTEEACSNKNTTPYMQETQVDTDIADEDTSNSVSLFGTRTQQYSDVSDSDTKTVNEETNQMLTSNQRNYEYQTLSDISDDSDFIIVDSPDDRYEAKTQCKTDLFGDNGETHLEELYEAQTQVNETDHADSNEDICESKADKGNVEDLYMAETQVDQPGPSSLSNDIPVKGKGSSQCLSKQTSVNEIFEVETQVDEPGPSHKYWGLHDVKGEIDSSNESFSGEDPQLPYYIPQKKFDNNLRNKRLSQNLGIEFESFSEDDNAYHAITEAISTSDSHDSDDLLASIDATPRKQHIEIAVSDTSIGNDEHATHVTLKTVSKIGKENIEDQDLYNMATQTGPADLLTRQESSSSSVIIIPEMDEEGENTDDQSSNNNDCLPATQAYIEFDSDEQINNEDIFNMATQNDDCDNLKTDENSDDSISILSPSKDKGSRKVKAQGSFPDDVAYFIATKTCMKDVSKQENDEAEEVDFYNMATQKDKNDMESDESIDENFGSIPKSHRISSNKVKHLESSADEDVYSTATQAFVEEIRDETEEEDLFNMATQKDISSIKKKTRVKMCLNDTLVQTDTENDEEQKTFSRDIDKIDADDKYLQATQAYMDDDTEQQEIDVDDIYNMTTQKDDSDTNISSLPKNNKNEFDEAIGHLDSDDVHDAYLAATQAEFGDINDHEDKHEEVDVFNIATQKNIYDSSSDENDVSWNNLVKDANEGKTKNKSSNKDSRCKQFTIDIHDANDEAYYMETQCDELPDILPSSDVEEIDLLTYSSEDDVNTGSNRSEQTASSSNKVNEIDEKVEKSYLGTKSILKRPHAESISERNVRFESSAAKKPRFILPERKTISIEPQPMKTTVERSATGLSHTFKPQQFFRAPNTGAKNSDIEVSDATKSDMWLSKKIPTKHIDKKGSKSVKVKKRKRKSDEGDSLQARMMAAKSQLKERAMYTATHPDSIKRVKTAPTGTNNICFIYSFQNSPLQYV